ncbi:MAG: hypothetical protein NWR50_00490 [Crocinitomicaceae bacterium]|nr:hypothetical protein [Crocinitomicaceae bacterium]
MKITLLSFLLIGIYFVGLSQVHMKMNIGISDTVLIDKYEPLENEFKVQYLKMAPGSHHFGNERAAELLRKETIVAVDLVYSDYPEGEDFTELNIRRLIELYSALPDAFNRSIVSWRIVKQTGVAKTGGIQNYFHGFVVYYREMPTNYAENKLIQDIINGKTKPEDSTLLKIFERNKAEWKDMLVVCDVTGSMSPYTAQLLLWIKANQKLRNMKDIVFFNDDDEKSTNETVREDKTGMWSASSGDFKKVMEVAATAMKDGQHIENNLEAVCRAIKEFPDGKGKVIMIADNWEDPCDMQLLSYLKAQKIPLRIIICGVNASINTIYLDLARATGGSVHTMEGDLTDLATMGEGKKLKIGNAEVVLYNGKFYQTKK